jgi:hypothetical protein
MKQNLSRILQGLRYSVGLTFLLFAVPFLYVVAIVFLLVIWPFEK